MSQVQFCVTQWWETGQELFFLPAALGPQTGDWFHLLSQAWLALRSPCQLNATLNSKNNAKIFAYAKTKPAVRVKSEHYRLRAKRALATECEAFYPMPLKPLCSADDSMHDVERTKQVNEERNATVSSKRSHGNSWCHTISSFSNHSPRSTSNVINLNTSSIFLVLKRF